MNLRTNLFGSTAILITTPGPGSLIAQHPFPVEFHYKNLVKSQWIDGSNNETIPKWAWQDSVKLGITPIQAHFKKSSNLIIP